MLTDFYEITMANGYFTNHFENTIGYYDMFFRKVPNDGGFAIMAGVQQVVEYIENLTLYRGGFGLPALCKDFSASNLLSILKFQVCLRCLGGSGGNAHFPRRADFDGARPGYPGTAHRNHDPADRQPSESDCHQGQPHCARGPRPCRHGVWSRRAQGADGAIYGARAAYIGGCCGTACTICDRDFGIPALGTMAHSWVQLFDSELEAFRAYAREYPSSCTLLVDTYNVLKSGVPNAIKVFNEILLPQGYRPAGIRVLTAATSPICRKKRVKCWMKPVSRIVKSAHQTPLMNILYAICSCRVPVWTASVLVSA